MASGRPCGSTSAPTVRTTSAPRTAKTCGGGPTTSDEGEDDPFTVDESPLDARLTVLVAAAQVGLAASQAGKHQAATGSTICTDCVGKYDSVAVSNKARGCGGGSSPVQLLRLQCGRHLQVLFKG